MSRLSHRIVSVAILSLGLLGGVGCATNRQYSYRLQPVNTTVATQRSVAVGAQDQRPAVLKGDEKEDYVGSQRAGYGNPWKVKTKGKEPLAPIFADQIAASLQKNGAKATVVRIALRTDRPKAIAAMQATGAERLLLVSIEEWDSDTYYNTDLDYNLHMEVFDKEGTLMAESRVKAKDTIQNGFWNSAGNAEDQAPAAFSERVTRLFADAKIYEALR